MSSYDQVNISVRLARNLVEKIDNLLKERGQSPARTSLEIHTERELKTLRDELHSRIKDHEQSKDHVRQEGLPDEH